MTGEATVQLQGPRRPFAAGIEVPGDKSLSHRALVLAALATHAGVRLSAAEPPPRRHEPGMLRLAGEQQADTAYLEVRASNRAALALYEGEGFIEDGVRKDYYPAGSGREDALLMSKEL